VAESQIPINQHHHCYRLHPVDIAESGRFLPTLPLATRTQRLLLSGGFPEALLHPGDAARLRNDRLELVTREDLRVPTRHPTQQAITCTTSASPRKSPALRV
jgi:hypothetical protein